MKKEEKIKCPTWETLNAYFDGELERDSPEFAHISSCHECCRQLEKIRNISENIKMTLLKQAGEVEISEKCISVLRFSQKRSAVKYSSFSEIFLRAAAVFAIFASVVFYILHLIEQKEAEKIKSARREREVERRTVAGGDSNTLEVQKIVAEENRIQRGSQLNSLELSDMKNVIKGRTSSPADEVLWGGINGENAKLIADSVRHAWLWQNDKGFAPKIEEIARRAGISAQPVWTGEGAYSLRASKRELVGFVRALHAAGYQLLSPEEPQPESERFIGSPDEEVYYNFTLVIK